MAAGDLNTAETSVLRNYPRAVAHLWRQLDDNHLSIVFGAGASKSLGFPDWPELVGRVSQHDDIRGDALLGASADDPLPTAAQVLLQRYDRLKRAQLQDEVGDHALLDELVDARWRDVVKQCLYDGVPATDDDELLSRDTVYKHFLGVVRESPLTVTYNFDDSLERLLLHTRPAEMREEARGFNVVVDARLPFRLKEGNIFHINGYLPANPLEGVGNGIVFAEGAFADQLLETVRGANATLLHFLTKNTFLLIGLSLNDENLRHLLRLNAVLNPGHYHYRLHYIRDPASFDAENARELADAHFRTFNIITLFLAGSEIAGLGRLLSREGKDLRERSNRMGVDLFFTYYLTGVPGVGKTTCFTHMSSLVAHDEWLDERIPELSIPAGDLSDPDRAKVDHWVADQVRKKNNRLIDDRDHIGIGVNIVDRCPLDALSFTTDPDAWTDKAKDLRRVIRDENLNRPVHPGSVLVLLGDPSDVRARAFIRGRQSGAPLEWIRWLQESTCIAYNMKGSHKVNVGGLTIPEMVRKVASIVLRDEYVPSDLDRRLSTYEGGHSKRPPKWSAPK
jgi:hypothetical protein